MKPSPRPRHRPRPAHRLCRHRRRDRLRGRRERPLEVPEWQRGRPGQRCEPLARRSPPEYQFTFRLPFELLRIADQLDLLGVHYIEGGWPGANPKDEELFRRAPAELDLTTSTLVAFGSTRRAGVDAADDVVLADLL